MTRPQNDLFYIRPIRSSDAKDLLALIKLASGGLSSLQPRLEFVKDYIQKSEASFSGRKDPNTPHKYLLALFDGDNDKLVGCAAVKTEIGVDSPFINFDLSGEGAEQYLEASSRFKGATEVGSLFLHPDYREGGLGRYLAKVRYLLIGSEPWRFGETVIAELRGICGEDGSPLYDYLFEERLERSFLEADAEYYDRNPDALGDIVPLGKIGTADFPLDVKASLGQPHPSGVGAMRLLQGEGFIFSGTIDLFDAGPIMSVHRDTIRTIMHSQDGQLVAQDAIISSDTMLIATGKVADFRAIVCNGIASQDKVMIPQAAIDALGAAAGDEVSYWVKPGLAAHSAKEKTPKTSHV